jgi:hypothetical protein
VGGATGKGEALEIGSGEGVPVATGLSVAAEVNELAINIAVRPSQIGLDR